MVHNLLVWCTTDNGVSCISHLGHRRRPDWIYPYLNDDIMPVETTDIKCSPTSRVCFGTCTGSDLTWYQIKPGLNGDSGQILKMSPCFSCKVERFRISRRPEGDQNVGIKRRRSICTSIISTTINEQIAERKMSRGFCLALMRWALKEHFTFFKIKHLLGVTLLVLKLDWHIIWNISR